MSKTQDYIGEVMLLNGALDYLVHEEGRIVAEANQFWSEFFVKDHLGNVRQVLRSPVSQTFTATMEIQNAETEEMEFSQVSASRQTEAAHNVTGGGDKVAWLNAGRGRVVGPGRTQEIYAGDSLKLQVYGKYLEDRNQKANAGSFMVAGGKEKLVADLNELAVSTQRAGGANPLALLNLADILARDLQKKEAPEAYLMYALYDQDSNRYEVGKKALSKNAANQHEVLAENMYISRDGYMETFVVNETSEDVWFDNMMVQSISPAVVQETHYDPWGLELTGLGFQYQGIKANKYLYNGKELLDDLNLNLYDYGARYFDPVIGHWTSSDPMASERSWVSPYNYVQNNPMIRIDPDGRFDWYLNENTKEYTWFEGSDNREGYKHIGGKESVLGEFEGKLDGIHPGGIYKEGFSFELTSNKKGALLPTDGNSGGNFLDEFMNGTGPTVSILSQDHPYTKTMKKASTVQKAQKLLSQGKTEVPGQITGVAGKFGIKEFFTSTTIAEQFIGSYRYDAFSSKEGNSVLNIVSDSKSRTSLLYHLPFNNVERNHPSAVKHGAGNTYQYYIWKTSKND